MNRILTSSALAVLLTCVGVAAAETERNRQSFKVQPGGTLRIDADIAEVGISTSDSSSLVVQYEHRFRTTDEAEVKRLKEALSAEIAQKGNDVHVTIRLRDDIRGRLRNRMKVELEIAMPREFNLQLRTGGSATVAGDLRGVVEASTSGGSLSLRNVSGAAKVASSGGSLTIGDVGDDLDARSSGGSVKTGRVAGSVKAQASGGSVSIAEARNVIEASASGGSVTAALANQPSATCSLTASGGGVKLQLPAHAAFEVDAECSAGGITSDFDVASQRASDSRLRGAVNGGGPTIKLRAAAGSIRLSKGNNRSSASITP